MGRRKFFQGPRKFSNGHCDFIPLQIFFILTSINTKVLFILHTKFQPKIFSRCGENGDFNSFAIFSNGSHLEFSIRLNFTILKPWSLIITGWEHTGQMLCIVDTSLSVLMTLRVWLRELCCLFTVWI